MTRHPRGLAATLLLAIATLAACGGGTPTPTGPEAPLTPATGTLGLTVAGLPSGTAGAVQVTGPGSFSRAVTATGDLAGLTPGTYTVVAANVTAGTSAYAGTPASQQVTVAASARATATVTYAATQVAPSTGRLVVTFAGLPGGTAGAVTVTGPSGYTHSTTASPDTLANLAPGTYTLAASTVTSTGTAYAPTPATQTAAVTAGGTASGSVTYATTGATSLNLTVDAAYLVQTVQDQARSVGLTQGKPGWIRVFARATQANSAQPAVRVRLYQGSTLVQTYTIAAPGTGVPTAVDESSLTNSWNVAVPGNLIQPGLALLADVDPANGVVESSETDNSYPQNGTPVALGVRPVPVFQARLVPVITRGNGLQGDASTANAATYTATLLKVWPFASVDVDVRAAYTTTDTSSLTSSNSNGAWGTVLSEIYALRRADSSSRYYMAAVATTYSSGVAGIGYVGAPAAVSWDKSGSRGSVAAHEWGHNLGLNHAPCGGAANPDPNYPYSGGTTGIWGLDVALANASGIGAAGVLKAPTSTDLMGYCGNQWVSDYNYHAVLNFLTGAPAVVGAMQAVQPSLVVWGRIADGRVVLEPAFEATTRPALPSGHGPFTLEGVDAAGRALFSWAFEGDLVDHDPAGARHFAFAIPLAAARRSELAGLRVRAGGAVAERRSAAPVGALDAGVAGRALRVTGAGRGMGVSWDADSYPLAVVRDAATGEILSLARYGSVSVAAPSGRVTVDLSDGVRSIRAGAQ